MCLKVKGQIEKSAVVCSCLLIDERVSVPAVEVREWRCEQQVCDRTGGLVTAWLSAFCKSSV